MLNQNKPERKTVPRLTFCCKHSSFLNPNNLKSRETKVDFKVIEFRFPFDWTLRHEMTFCRDRWKKRNFGELNTTVFDVPSGGACVDDEKPNTLSLSIQFGIDLCKNLVMSTLKRRAAFLRTEMHLNYSRLTRCKSKWDRNLHEFRSKAAEYSFYWWSAPNIWSDAGRHRIDWHLKTSRRPHKLRPNKFDSIRRDELIIIFM